MKYNSFQLKDVSTYRSEIMGWSILWVMMLHFDFKQLVPLGFLSQFGLAGVDVFLFVSGFGIFHSLDKSNNLLKFYLRRSIRIIPIFYLIGVFGSILLFHDSFLQYLYRYSTLAYWIGGLSYTDWYISSIILFYLVSPLIKYIIEYKIVYAYVIVIFFIVTAYYIIDKDYIIDRPHYCFFHRIPDYIIGMICGYWLKYKKPVYYFYLILVIGIPVFIYLYPHHHQISNYFNFSLMFLMPFFTWSFIIISKFTWRPISSIIHKMGNASLEIYLIQGLFAYAFSYKVLPVPDYLHDYMTIFLIIFCSLLGCIFHWGVEEFNLYKCLEKKLYSFSCLITRNLSKHM